MGSPKGSGEGEEEHSRQREQRPKGSVTGSGQEGRQGEREGVADAEEKPQEKGPRKLDIKPVQGRAARNPGWNLGSPPPEPPRPTRLPCSSPFTSSQPQITIKGSLHAGDVLAASDTTVSQRQAKPNRISVPMEFTTQWRSQSYN